MSRTPRAEAPSRPVSVKLSPLERGRLQTAARRNRQTVSAFLREVAAAAVADCLDPDEWRDAAAAAHALIVRRSLDRALDSCGKCRPPVCPSQITVPAASAGRRRISGICSTPRQDRMGDVVNPLGMTWTNPVPLHVNHDQKQPCVGLRR